MEANLVNDFSVGGHAHIPFSRFSCMRLYVAGLLSISEGDVSVVSI